MEKVWRRIFRVAVAAVVLCLSQAAMADGYKDLWKQVEEAENKDLPKTVLSLLDKIIAQSEREGEYAHMLKAELKRIRTITWITPDSLALAVEALVDKQHRAAGKDSMLDAVMCAVLGGVYENNPTLSDEWESIARRYYDRALADPHLLARHKQTEWQPLLTDGTHDGLFNHDLLHVIALQAGRFAGQNGIYDKAGNRVAALLTALDKVRGEVQRAGSEEAHDVQISSLDSLIALYGDLDWAGEAEWEKYNILVRKQLLSDEERYSYLHKAVDRWSNWYRIALFANELTRVTNPYLNVDFGNRMMRSNERRNVRITGMRHLQDIILTITRVDIDGNDADVSVDNDEGYRKLRTKLASKPVYRQHRNHLSAPQWRTDTDSFEVEKLPLGTYLMEVSSTDNSLKPIRRLLNVSDLYVMCEGWPGERQRYTVVNAITGKPVEGAKIRIRTRYGYNTKNNNEQHLLTDKNGEAICQVDRSRPANRVWVSTAKDRSFLDTDLGSSYSFFGDERTYTDVHLYTDRAIYRPGQTVSVGVICNQRHADNSTPVVAERKITLRLLDANYKEVEQKEVTTDGFGTASCQFQLPESGLTGRFQVQAVGYGSTSFNVEEYKRPTFLVEIGEPEGQYAIGDTLTVKGTAKTYAGVAVQGATVKYEIERRAAIWWRYYGMPNDNARVWTDTVQTDVNGEFRLRVPLVVGESGKANASSKRNPRFYSFTINADVTDVGGETHHGYATVPVGDRPSAFWCDVPDMAEKDSLQTIRFSYRNSAGKDISGKVTYWFDDNAKAYTTDANTDADVRQALKALRSGKHTLHAICGSDTLQSEVVLFSWKDTKPCYPTHDWFYAPATTFPSDGGKLNIQVGSSDDEVYIYHTAIANGKVLDYGVTKISNEILTKSYAYSESYGDGLYLSFAWVRNDTLYNHSVQLRKPLPSKALDVQWSTFRDRLEPGQHETWTATVTTPEGTPADAQLMAVLYDKSLDQIKQHNWNFYLPLRQKLPFSYWQGVGYYGQTGSWSKAARYADVPLLSYARLSSELLSFYDIGLYGMVRGIQVDKHMASMRFDAAPMVAESASAGVMLARKNSADMSAKEMLTSEDEADSGDNPAAATAQGELYYLRENLNETAFFLPALRTDTVGNVVIDFTLPEELTTWRFIGLAHDRKSNFGMLSADVIAQKKVMIQPNIPRFLRAADEANITARLFNTTDKTKEGVATLELLDPATMAVVYTQSRSFTIEQGSTTPVTFTCRPDGNTTMYVCRLVAKGADFADGEQQYLAVLPEKELVTNTVAFTMHGAGTKAIDVGSLFAVNDTTNRLTVEFTNNPAWLMIQTLPTYSAAAEENVIDQAVAYYVNVLGRHMLRQSPHIRQVVDLWRAEGEDGTSLWSTLQQNEELKNIILNETPWVLEADNEASQKRNLIKFFDEPTMDLRLNTALKKMGELQLADGSWAWWKGMRGNIHMTVSVCTLLERLNLLIGACDDNTSVMLQRAYDYVDAYLLKEYEAMRKDEKKGIRRWRPSETIVDILYLNAIAGRKLSTSTQRASEYMLNLLEKRTTELTIYGKATAAVVLAKNKRGKKAAEYLQSMEEYSVMTDEMGRYYDTPKAYYSWRSYKIPTQVTVIEAFRMLQPEKKQTIAELQRWLLAAKRTQSWSTPVNTVNAVYAFLSGNMAVLEAKEEASIRLDGTMITPSSPTAGSGYVKHTQQGTDMRTLTVEKPSEGTSWGAVYAQFMQKSTDVDSSDGQLTVRREITGVNNRLLKVGDRVTVRITIKAGRDFDFVQVVDKRAACMEPTEQLSGYHRGYYIAPKDNATCYYFDQMAKGTHMIETQYYVDRAGVYHSGTCTAQCAYSPEYASRDKAVTLTVTE